MTKEIRNIFYQSLPPIIVASFLSSIGGISLSIVREKVLLILPLLILLPALNNMVGDYGTIIASKFTTWLYRGTIPPRWWKSKRLRNLLKNIFIIACLYSFLNAFLASALSLYQGFSLTTSIFLKITFIGISTAAIIVIFLSFLVILVGIFLYRRRLDPDNYLIPFATALADLGALIVFGGLTRLLFK